MHPFLFLVGYNGLLRRWEGVGIVVVVVGWTIRVDWRVASLWSRVHGGGLECKTVCVIHTLVAFFSVWLLGGC